MSHAPMFTPGIRYDLPFPEYLAIEALSSSGARTILRSPAHYVEARTNPDPATPDLMFGSAVHVGVLEPLRFATDVLVMPSFNRRTNAGKEDAAAWEAANAGRLAFDAETFERIHRCIGAIRNHDGAMTILSRATCEVTMQWVDPATGVPCKARIDARRPDAVLGDLKTTQDASPAAFARSIGKFGYHVQAAHYGAGHELTFGEPARCWVWIAAEKKPPYGVATYACPDDALIAGAERRRRALERYAKCMADQDEWLRVYPTTIQPIAIPRWALTTDD